MIFTFLIYVFGLNLTHIVCMNGMHPKPSLWAVPGSVVAKGSPLSIFCQGPVNAIKYHLEKVGSSQVWHKEDSQGIPKEVEFSFPNVTSSHAGSYTCLYEAMPNLSERSSPLELIVTGAYKDKPTLSAHPSAMVPLGGGVILHCHLPNTYDTFLLSKGEKLAFIPDFIQEGQKDFHISPVFRDHAGIYRCYGAVNGSRHKWSAPSDGLEVIVTGVYEKPQLSALQGPSVMSREKRVLQCHSEVWFDMFLLIQEGSGNSTQRRKSQYRHGLFQANFTMGPMWKTHRDTYRCYGSISSFSFLWSDPSEPLTFPERRTVTVTELRVSLGGIFLLLLLGFLVEAWLSRKDLLGAVKRPSEGLGRDRVL